MVNLRILIPEATTNYVLNPALRYDTTGWTAYGATITRSLDQARFGVASLKVATNGTVTREGTYYRVSSLTGVSEPVTVSAYVRGETGNELVHIRLWNTAGKEWVSTVAALRSDRWTRLTVSGFSTGTNDLRLYVETDGTARAVTFYVDGAQMERKAYATSYCDGNQPGCRWNVVDHGSTSTREAYTRQGGRWINLAGPDRQDNNVYVTVLNGLGMPPITVNTQSWALAAGSYFQSIKVLDRTLTMTFWVKKEDMRTRCTPDLAQLYQLRQELVELFKPDLTAGDEAFQFEYDDGERALRIWARYEAGLEGSWDVRNQWVNSFPVRFLAVDPYWQEDNQNASALNFIQRSNLVYRIMMRMNGEWNNMNYGLNGGTGSFSNQIIASKKGEIYAGGTFSVVNNNASAVDPLKSAQRLAYFDGTSWKDVSTAVFAPVPLGYISSLYFAPNGDLYVTGNFTQIGGVAANYVAKWNGSAWSALGTGLDAAGYVITGDANGNIYVGGLFTTAGGISAVKIARWDGAWHQMGARRGLNNTVYSIAVNADGTKVYVAGNFTDENGLATTTLDHVCLFTPSSNTFSALGSGLNNTVQFLVISPYSGKLYAAGSFTASGSTTINYVASWNGSAWGALGNDLPSAALGLSILPGEKLIASAAYGAGLFIWNTSTWVSADILLSTAEGFLGLGNGDIVLALSQLGSRILHSAITYLTNYGTADVKPVVYIYGPGKLIWLENQSTKKTCYFNMTIASTEEVVIDFGKGTVTSSLRGNIINELLAGSDFGDFSLVPGQNKLCCFMTNDVNSKMYMYYTPRHWSADAVVRPDAP